MERDAVVHEQESSPQQILPDIRLLVRSEIHRPLPADEDQREIGHLVEPVDIRDVPLQFHIHRRIPAEPVDDDDISGGVVEPAEGAFSVPCRREFQTRPRNPAAARVLEVSALLRHGAARIQQRHDQAGQESDPFRPIHAIALCPFRASACRAPSGLRAAARSQR